MHSSEFRELVQEAVVAFRLGREAQGSEKLVAIVDLLPVLVSTVPSTDLPRLNGMFSAMLAAQGRRDFLFLADLLEYELLAVLTPSSWQ